MIHPQKRFAAQSTKDWVARIAVAFLLAGAARCKSTGPNTRVSEPVTLRVGVAQVELASLIRNQTIESLARAQEDGRHKPALAKSWSVSDDGLIVKIEIRPAVQFHDGAPLLAATVVSALKSALPNTTGPVFDDVSDITATDETTVQITLKRPSTLLLDAVLETEIMEPGKEGVGTGPFIASQNAGATELRANPNYYLGPPSIDHIAIQTYPSARSAWAEMLRNQVDMVYELGVDAMDSLQTATSVSLYSFVRRYQYAILFNAHSTALQQPRIRQALNAAIDRDALVRDAFSGHALPSSGPVWPKNWAAGNQGATAFDQVLASKILDTLPRNARANGAHRLTFSCLITTDEGRLALAVKQQLARYDVEMVIEEVALPEFNKRASKSEFESALAPIVSAPTLFRPYLWWHSHAPLNRMDFASAAVDRGLDRIQRARSDEEYRVAVAAFQSAVAADPPALFLAWAEAARAVSTRFEIPAESSGIDILSVLRMWRPVAGAAHADKN